MLPAFLLLSGFVLIAGAEGKFTVSGVGGYPISSSITSMWLASPDHRPLLMAYFQGPDGWHNTQWKIGSKFEKGKPGWAEFKSDRATLRLWVDTETREAEVQSSKFKLDENNTFLVLHEGEPSVSPEIVPLGVFELPASSKDKPASVLLLETHPEIVDKIKKAIAQTK